MNGEEATELLLEIETMVETVCLLSKLHANTAMAVQSGRHYFTLPT